MRSQVFWEGSWGRFSIDFLLFSPVGLLEIFLMIFGRFLEAFWESFSINVRYFFDQKSSRFFDRFFIDFWMDFEEFLNCPTSVFIGRGGELVGSRFSHASPKLSRKPLKKRLKNHPKISPKTIEKSNKKQVGFPLK